MPRVVWYSTATLILAGLFGWLATTTVSVALADVIKAAAKHSLVRYKRVQIVDDKSNGMHVETPSTVYADLKAARWQTETKYTTADGAVVMTAVQDSRANRSLMTNSLEKTATLLDGSGKTTKTLLDNLRALQDNKRTTSEKDILDGRETVKYRLQDTNAKTPSTSTLWVDAKTMLPVRFETEMAATERLPLNKFVCSDYEWDPEVKDMANLFSTVVPNGYTTIDRTGKN